MSRKCQASDHFPPLPLTASKPCPEEGKFMEIWKVGTMYIRVYFCEKHHQQSVADSRVDFASEKPTKILYPE